MLVLVFPHVFFLLLDAAFPLFAPLLNVLSAMVMSLALLPFFLLLLVSSFFNVL